MLQRDRTFGEKTVVEFRGLVAVEHCGDVPPLDGDLVSIPFAAGLGHRMHFDEIDDRACPVSRVRPLIVDIRLVTCPGADGLGIATAHEDAAVGVVARPELDIKLEVLE